MIFTINGSAKAAQTFTLTNPKTKLVPIIIQNKIRHLLMKNKIIKKMHIVFQKFWLSYKKLLFSHIRSLYYYKNTYFPNMNFKIL